MKQENNKHEPAVTYKELYLQKQMNWQEIEELVTIYQKRFGADVDINTMIDSDKAGEDLYARFENLFKKYLALVKTGNINWTDTKMKKFITLFIKEKSSRLALSRTKSSAEHRREIHSEFSFVVDTYGILSEEDIMSDLHVAFAQLLKRYEKKDRTFCGYVNNAFHFYFYRQVTAYTKDPLSIRRNIVEMSSASLEDDAPKSSDGILAKEEDDTYEHNLGIPDHKWITGEECGDIFKDLTPLQRKIVVKYYLEEWSDRQIAEAYCMHPNAINQHRRRAVETLAKSSGIGRAFIRRVRNSGFNAKLPKR